MLSNNISDQSKLTVAADKGGGVIGEADLNLSEYKEDEFNILKLSLKNCQDSDGYIEVGLKANQVKTPKGGSGSTAGAETGKDQVMALV